ncbi:MAG: hypothetical protein U0Q16_21915 [Bryobacteraceae bacterium]
MAMITVSGPPGCPTEAAARLAAQRLAFHFLSESAVRRLVAEEYGGDAAIPARVYGSAVVSILARLAREQHLVVCSPGAEVFCAALPDLLRVSVIAPERYRVGILMVDHRMDRAKAEALLGQLETQQRALRRKQFRRAAPLPEELDVTVNAQHLDADQIASVIESAARARQLDQAEMLSAAQEAEIEFQARLELAKHGIVPAGTAGIQRKPFVNQSEEVFANLLDFYRIAWEYEPKSFPIEWDGKGHPLASFTPDFYLPEFDLYIELTTMKQANVTRKNGKLKRLRQIYPNVNIQVFYQRDFQNLIFKFGLAERTLTA